MCCVLSRFLHTVQDFHMFREIYAGLNKVYHGMYVVLGFSYILNIRFTHT